MICRAVQAPTWGYPTEGAYYRDAQSVDAVSAIKIPFLAINAEDDPVSTLLASWTYKCMKFALTLSRYPVLMLYPTPNSK